MQIDARITAKTLEKDLKHFIALAAKKVPKLNVRWKDNLGSPVFTVRGKYTTRGWTEWTQGFMYGSQVLLFDATDDPDFYWLGLKNIRQKMGSHVTHCGVHDHGFNNVSTYGNLRRLIQEGRVQLADDVLDMSDMALRASGAVQAMRWTKTRDGGGYMYSFNGPHSLFSDTIRSCRSLVLAEHLGQVLMGEHDEKIDLLHRAMDHIRTTLRYNVFYGEGRDRYDVPGRVAHEGLFNTNDGRYRCPSTQQGYSPFTTWTRGLAWVLLGCAEQLEYFKAIPKDKRAVADMDGSFVKMMLRAARVTADFYMANSTRDGIPYWDTGAPGLALAGDYTKAKAEPDNPHEPLDSSAAVIVAQGMLRLGAYLGKNGRGKQYWQAGLSITRTLLRAPFLSEDENHEGLILHSVYHRPNGWDYVPKGATVPLGESSMWGDYHALELAVYLQREISGAKRLTFY